MSPEEEHQIIERFRSSTQNNEPKFSVESRKALFNELDSRKGNVSGWIWKLAGLGFITASCWLVLMIPETELPHAQESIPALATSTEESISEQPKPASSLYTVWKAEDPFDASLQNIQQRLQKEERSELFSDSTDRSRINSLQQRIQRLRDDLS